MESYSKRLEELKARRLESKTKNHQDVVAEAESRKLPANWEAKKKRLEYETMEDDFKRECKEKGLDPERMSALEMRADVVEKLEAKKRRRQNVNTGYSKEEASYRKYKKLTSQLKPDVYNYEKEKEDLTSYYTEVTMMGYTDIKANRGDTFYPTADTLGLNQRKDSKEGLERLVKDMEKREESRANRSRRRAFDDEAGVDYINERNYKFNKKLERFYGTYTAEIKKNLERGTAI